MVNAERSDRLSFPATLRNRASIADVLRNYIPDNGVLLEIASGSGEHGVFFQKSFPSIIWQTSDPALVHRKSINAWIAHQKFSLKMPEPLEIDVEKSPWPITNKLRSLIKGIVCINMIHVSPWSCTNALFKGSKSYLDPNQFLMLYGPFLRNDKQNSESNLKFDQSLQSKNQHWGLRYLERVNEIAFKNGFENEKIFEMPANNLSVIYRFN